MNKIEKIKNAITIPYLWRLMNLPGEPGKHCRCPWRPDKDPSFVIYQGNDGDRWYDHGNAMKGDCIDFYAMCKDITVPQAIENLLAMLGDTGEPMPQAGPTFRATAKAAYKAPEDLRMPTDEEIFALALLRSLDPAAFDLARKLGTLMAGKHPRSREEMWFITDVSGHGAEGRRFDGRPCRASNKKSAAVQGSDKSWPYGLVTTNEALNKCRNIMLCEGGPDYYAAIALSVLAEFTPPFLPVTMLGANCSIGEETKPYFKGKTVLIIPHNDEEGVKASEKWKLQLRDLGTEGRMIQRIPEQFKDLNELVSSNENPLPLLQGLK